MFHVKNLRQSSAGESLKADYPVLSALMNGEIEQLFEQTFTKIQSDFSDTDQAKAVAAALVLRKYTEECSGIEKKVLDMQLRQIPFEALVDQFYMSFQDSLQIIEPIEDQLQQLSGSQDLYFLVEQLPPSRKATDFLSPEQVNQIRALGTDIADAVNQIQAWLEDLGGNLNLMKNIKSDELVRFSDRLSKWRDTIQLGVNHFINDYNQLKQEFPLPPRTIPEISKSSMRSSKKRYAPRKR